MTKRRITTVEEDEGGGATVVAPAKESFDDDLARVVAELGEAGGGTVKVERLRDGKRLEYVEEFDAAAFSLKALQQQFGGGEYRITLKDEKGRYKKSGNVAIAQPRTPPPAAVATPADDALQKITAALAKQGELLALLLMQSRSPPPAQSTEDTRRALLSDLTLMKELVGGGQSFGAEKILEVMRLGMEIAKDASGEQNWTDVIGKAIDAFGEPIAQVLTAQPSQQPAPSPPAASPSLAMRSSSPGPAMLQVSSPKPKGPKPKEREKMNFERYVVFLVERAAVGSDPELYAELIVDNVPEPLLKGIMADGKIVERLAAVDRRVNDHLDWFKTLGQAVAELLADAAPPSAPGAGNGAPGGAA